MITGCGSRRSRQRPVSPKPGAQRGPADGCAGRLVLLINLSLRAARGVATAQQCGQPTHEQLQLEFPKLSHDRIDPLMKKLGQSITRRIKGERRGMRIAPNSVGMGGKSSFVKVIDTAWLCTGKNIVASN